MKGVDSSLLSLQDIMGKLLVEKDSLNSEEEQILGEVLWYKKVLYTNGVRWKYIEWQDTKDEQDFIKELVEARIKHESRPLKESDPPLEKFNWCNHIDICNLKIKEEDLLIDLYHSTENDWIEFVDKLHHMKWN